MSCFIYAVQKVVNRLDFFHLRTCCRIFVLCTTIVEYDMFGTGTMYHTQSSKYKEGGHSTYDSVFIRVMPKLEISMLTPIIRYNYIVTCYIHIMGTLNIVIITR